MIDIFRWKPHSANNMFTVDNSVYDYVIYDSTTVERPFAVALDSNPDVKMSFKIWDKFKIEAPIGTYIVTC